MTGRDPSRVARGGSRKFIAKKVQSDPDVGVVRCATSGALSRRRKGRTFSGRSTESTGLREEGCSATRSQVALEGACDGRSPDRRVRGPVK